MTTVIELLDIQMYERLRTGVYTWVIGPKHGHMHVKRGNTLIFIPHTSIIAFVTRKMHHAPDGTPWEVCVNYTNVRNQFGQEAVTSNIGTSELALSHSGSLNDYINSISQRRRLQRTPSVLHRT